MAFHLVVFSAEAFSPVCKRYRNQGIWRLHFSSNANAIVDNDKTKYQKLFDWLFQEQSCQGQDSVQINVSSQQRRRGLYSRKDFKEGDTIFTIPLSTALVVEESETTDAERGMKFLEFLHSADEELQVYRNVIPTKTHQWDPTPDFWTDEQIAQLEFPRLVDGVLERKCRIESLARNMDLDLEDLQFATWLVESRSLTLVKEPYPDCPDEELETTSVMIPLLDMINHSSDDPNAELEVVEQNGGEVAYAVVALVDISKGEEILISYGTGEESSVELLQYYGFVPQNNSYDVDMLDFGGDDCLVEKDDWSTTLTEDENRLKNIENGNRVDKTILEFRVRMKRALYEWEELLEQEEEEE